MQYSVPESPGGLIHTLRYFENLINPIISHPCIYTVVKYQVVDIHSSLPVLCIAFRNLMLGHNHLSSLQDETLFQENKELRTVDLSGNNLTEIAANLFSNLW